MSREMEVQDILYRLKDEIDHLYYHARRHDSMTLAEQNAIVEKCVNELQSLIGYGTAAEPSTSGELLAFKYAMRDEKPDKIVFDVGAHHGEWFETVNGATPGPVHWFLFEPDSESHRILTEKGIKAERAAISQVDGESILFSHQPGAAQASLERLDFSHVGAQFCREETVRTYNLHSFCKQNRIQRIDFLKLDVEGHEMKVLLSISRLIAARRIGFIQFEFGVSNVDSRAFFKDFWALLAPHYKIFRIHPFGLIPVEKYRQELEVFHVANYLCELKDNG